MNTIKCLNYETIQLYQSQCYVNDFSGSKYSLHKNLRFNILMLRSDLCDHILTDNEEDLDNVMTVNNLLEYSDNYSMMS